MSNTPEQNQCKSNLDLFRMFAPSAELNLARQTMLRDATDGRFAEAAPQRGSSQRPSALGRHADPRGLVPKLGNVRELRILPPRGAAGTAAIADLLHLRCRRLIVGKPPMLPYAALRQLS